MTVRSTSIAVLAAALSWTVIAQTKPPIRAGNWSVTMKMSMPGMEMPAMTQTHCVTETMAKDPEGWVPKGPQGNTGDCKMSDYNFTANTATYKVTCTKPAPMTMVGQMKYTGTDAYSGTVTMDSEGKKMSMSFDAKRLGECPVQSVK